MEGRENYRWIAGEGEAGLGLRTCDGSKPCSQAACSSLQPMKLVVKI